MEPAIKNQDYHYIIMNIYEIPRVKKSYRFSQFVSLDRIECAFMFYFNGRDTAWYFDITAGGITRYGICLVAGLDLFSVVPSVEFPPGKLFCHDLDHPNGPGRDPDFETFGDRVRLVYQEV